MPSLAAALDLLPEQSAIACAIMSRSTAFRSAVDGSTGGRATRRPLICYFPFDIGPGLFSGALISVPIRPLKVRIDACCGVAPQRSVRSKQRVDLGGRQLDTLIAQRRQGADRITQECQASSVTRRPTIT